MTYGDIQSASEHVSLHAIRIGLPDLIGDVCGAFGWSVDHVLSMPARRFFAMLAQARKLRANMMADLCDIAAIPSCTAEYHKSLKGCFTEGLKKEEIPMEVGAQEALTGNDASNAMRMIFG